MIRSLLVLAVSSAAVHGYVPSSSSSSSAFSSASPLSRRQLLGGLSAGVLAGTAAAGAPAVAGAAGSVVVRGDESIMAPKAHGTTAEAVQKSLRFSVNNGLADRICSYNRFFAEPATSYTKTSFEKEFLAEASETKPMVFFDSVTGKPLFRAPVGRTPEDFLAESRVHGWPSFRDEEVVWDNMRILKDGESVSVDGTHLGHNLPDRSGNRYCINLVSISGRPA